MPLSVLVLLILLILNLCNAWLGGHHPQLTVKKNIFCDILLFNKNKKELQCNFNNIDTF